MIWGMSLLCRQDISKEDLLHMFWFYFRHALNSSCTKVSQSFLEIPNLLEIPLIAIEPNCVALKLERELS